jgi:hypothetical protein
LDQNPIRAEERWGTSRKFSLPLEVKDKLGKVEERKGMKTTSLE